MADDEKSTKTQPLLPGTDLPHDVLTLIGQVTVAFGQLEYVLQLCGKRLEGIGFEPGMAEAQRMKNVHKLKERVDELFQILSLDQTKEAEFGALLDKVAPLYQRRKRVIHGLFALDKDGRTAHQFELEAKYVDLAELAALHEAALALVLELNTYTKNLQSHVAP